MSKRLNILETSISVSLSSDKAQRDLKKLKEQIKDTEKTDKVNERRTAKRQQKHMRQATREHKIRSDSQKRSEDSLKAREALQKRLAKHKTEESRKDIRHLKLRARLEAEAERRKIRAETLTQRRSARAHRIHLNEIQRANTLYQRQQRLKAEANARARSSFHTNARTLSGNVGGVGRGIVGAGAVGAIGGTVAALQPAMQWENAFNALYTQESGKDPEGALERTQDLADKIYKMAGGLGVSNPEQLLKVFTELRPLTDIVDKETNEKKFNDNNILNMVATMSQSAKAMGTDPASFDRFMLGFRQFASNISAGAASGQEIGQMRDASAALATEFFRAMGFAGNISPDAAAELTQSGELNIDKIFEAMPKLMELTQLGFERQRNRTTQGAVDSFMVALNHMGRMFSEGSRGGIIQGLNTLSKAMMDNEDIIKRLGVWVGNALTGLADGIKRLFDAWGGMTDEKQQKIIDLMITAGKVIAVLTVLSTAMGFFYKILKPIFAIFSAIVALKLGAIVAALGAIGGFLYLLHKFGDKITEFFVGIANAIGAKISDVKDSVGNILSRAANAGELYSPTTPYGVMSMQPNAYTYGGTSSQIDNRNISIQVSSNNPREAGRNVLAAMQGSQGNFN